jgi:type IV secretion system protein VirB10
MRRLFILLLVSGVALGQAADTTKPVEVPSLSPDGAQAKPGGAKELGAAPTGTTRAETPDPKTAEIPAGTKIPLLLKQAISTKNAREGDAVYAESAFPFVVNNRILVPAGTYIQGKISHVERAGRMKGRSELLMHFTTMIYPSGYTLMLPGSIENLPGSENTTVKDKEGTIQQDKTTGKKIEDAAKGGAIGTMAGATAGGLATGGLNGARVGAGAGAAAGIAWALLKHGPDVRLEVGTSIEMEIQRAIRVDASRIQVARAAQ